MELTIDMLLSKRDYDSQAFTKKIIELFSTNLTKAVAMLYKLDRSIVWTKVERFLAVDSFVTVRGEVEIRPGDILTLPDGDVLITEENVHIYTRPVMFVLSSKILQHGTLEAIYQHVAFVDQLARSLPEAELVRTLRSGAVNEHVVMENPALKPILDRITRPTTFESFDTSTLTEEQFSSLRRCASAHKSKLPH